ncbi:hypothetical protein TTRE_0000951801 [Trichuris trichiura]|uniref:Major sperm protein n=1 Tax=Trichuris trichiura TaxID=36087 RepID=A0A077ZL97_TRITR|nr:hypothetical protein TTRE_0000951801 [Trichuris trichiura]
MEFVSGSRKTTDEVYPVDTIHFSRIIDITQLASIKLYNNSTEWIADKLKMTSPAEIKLPDQDMERTERCTMVAHVLPRGVKAVDAYDYWKSMMITKLIDKKYPLEVKLDVDGCDGPEPVSTSSYTSISITANTSSSEEPESTTSSSESVITSTSRSCRENGTYTTTSSIDSTTTVSSSGSSVGGPSSVSATGTSVESCTVGSETAASNGSFTQQSY